MSRFKIKVEEEVDIILMSQDIYVDTNASQAHELGIEPNTCLFIMGDGITLDSDDEIKLGKEVAAAFKELGDQVEFMKAFIRRMI